MKSLLHKTLSQFLVCTVAIFILTTPLFFLLTKYFYAEDMIDIIEAVQLGTSIPHIDLERDIMVGMMLQFSGSQPCFVYYDAFHYTSPVVAV